jgi:hypothetical protein
VTPHACGSVSYRFQLPVQLAWALTVIRTECSKHIIEQLA